MEDRSKKVVRKKKFSIISLLFAGFVAYSCWLMANQFSQLSALNSDMELAQQRLEAAQQENQQLKDEEARLSDNEYIEKLAREELGMTRQGEMPYIYAENK